MLEEDLGRDGRVEGILTGGCLGTLELLPRPLQCVAVSPALAGTRLVDWPGEQARIDFNDPGPVAVVKRPDVEAGLGQSIEQCHATNRSRANGTCAADLKDGFGPDARRRRDLGIGDAQVRPITQIGPWASGATPEWCLAPGEPLLAPG